MTQPLRLFIASHISKESAKPLIAVTDSLSAAAQKLPSANLIRWTLPAQWHLTWHFMGNTPQEQVPEIQQTLDTALVNQPAFSATWQELRWWPSRNRTQVLVCQFEAIPRFQAIYEAVGQGLQSCSFAEETAKGKPFNKPFKRFKPHITLARINSRIRGHQRLALPTLPELSAHSPPWRIDAITLYSSHLTSTGAIHTPLYSVQLG